MSDLSKVLGDLYGTTNPDGPPVKKEASAEERAAQASEETSSAATTFDPPDLQGTLEAALAARPLGWSSAAEEAEEWAESLGNSGGRLHQRGALRAWTRNDDDFLSDRGRKWNHRNKHH